MRSVIIGLAALVLGYLAARYTVRDPAPITDVARVRALYAAVLGEDVPRPTGSAASRRAIARISAHLSSLGYTPEHQRGFVCAPNGICAFVENVIVERTGTSTGAVVLAAHHDTVAASPGGYDDGAGVVAQLEIARVIAAEPAPLRTIVLMFTDGEELGLNGARLFVREHRRARRVDAMIALEAMGGPTTWYRGGESLAMQRYARAHDLPTPLSSSAESYLDPHPGFDANVFTERGDRALVFTGVGDSDRYHSPLDRGDRTDARVVAARTDAGLAYARALADALPDPPDTPAHNFLVPLFGSLAWPARATPVLGVLAALAVVALAIRRRSRTVARLAIEVAAVTALVAMGSLGGVALAIALRKIGWLTGMWITAPAALSVGMLGAIAAPLMVVSRGLDRWTGLVALALLGAAMAVVAPPGAHLAVLPALAGAVCAVVFERWRAIGPVVALAIAGLLVGQIDVMGWSLNMGPTYIFMATTAAIAAGLIATIEVTDRRRAVIGLASLGLAGIIIAGVAARWGDRALERVSVRLHTDLDRGVARWLVMDVLPDALAAAAPFEVNAAPFPWWPQAPAFVATATVSPPVEGPTLTGTSTPSGAHRRFVGVLRSPRGAWSTSLIVPPDAPIDAVRIEGAPAEIDANTVARSHGHRVFNIVGAGTASVAIELDVRGDAPVEVELVELDPGLPPAARGLTHRRAAHQIPAHAGDAWMVSRHTRL